MVRFASALVLCCLFVACASPAPPQATPSSPSEPAVKRTRLDGTGPLAIAEAGGSLWVANFDSATVSRVDPATMAETDSLTAGPAPAFLLPVGDRLWVESYGSPRDSRLSWIEPSSGKVGDAPPQSELCCNLATDGHDIWGIDPSGAVVSFDGTTGKLQLRLPVTIDRGFHSNLVVAGGAVWVSSDNADLQRVDPETGALTTVATGGGVPFTVDGDEIWGASGDEIWVVDAQTAKVVRHVPIPDSMEVLWLALDGDAIWLAIRHPGYIGAVLQMDRESGKVTQEIPAGIPSFVLSAFDAVWVLDYETSELIKIAA